MPEIPIGLGTGRDCDAPNSIKNNWFDSNLRLIITLSTQNNSYDPNSNQTTNIWNW
jgi:hypothetical protein